MFGAISLDNRQIFRQYDRFNENTFYEFLKQLRYKFPKCYLLLDKANPHYRSEKMKYLDEHKNSLIPVWLPIASPEFMILEECWDVSKNDSLVLSYKGVGPSFTDFRKRIGHYSRTKRFNLKVVVI